jgi:preprotein translocase subunit SecD
MAGTNRAFLLLMLFLLFPGKLVPAQEPAPTLEFRLADDADTPGWQRMEFPGSDKPIFVCGDASLNGSHIEKVSFFKDANGKPAIGFTLTDEGAKAMESTTSQNLRKRLAIVLNGKVVP